MLHPLTTLRWKDFEWAPLGVPWGIDPHVTTRFHPVHYYCKPPRSIISIMALWKAVDSAVTVGHSKELLHPLAIKEIQVGPFPLEVEIQGLPGCKAPLWLQP